MEVILCKNSGFCYGVSRALKTVNDNISNGSLCTYGSIINNKEVTNALEKKGVGIIDNIDNIENETVIIRSHGVTPNVYEKLEEKGINYIDCTCHDVKKIHKIAQEANYSNRTVIIIGNRNHPEIIGLAGYCNEKFIIIEKIGEIDNIDFDKNGKYSVVVQTTFVQDKFQEIASKLESLGLDLEINNTICPAMIKRQNEAEEVSKIVDTMIVIGDKTSSNTNKLYEICKKHCEKTYLVETIDDLELNIFHASVKIGIVAGASTPPDIIKEAFLRMNSIDNTGNNLSFEEMLDKSFVSLHTGDVVKGTVIQISNGEVSVNLGYKSDGLIPRNEFSDDIDVDPAKCVKLGDEIEVFVVRVNDGEGNVLLSKKKVDAKVNFDKLEVAYEEKTPLQGRVIEVVRGGVIALINQVRVFIPTSQVSNRYVEDLNSLKGKEFNFEILEFDKTKRRIVGGRKALALKEEAENKAKVYGTIEVGQQIDGVVSRITNFGAFVDIGGVDGLIHISELSWGRVKKVTDVLSEGDNVKVTVLEVEKEKNRISLSLKDVNKNPWHNIKEKYQVGQIVVGKVVRMTTFGAFVELEQGVDGLIHISQISEKHIVKPEDALKISQVIEIKIMEIDEEHSRISLSKKSAEGVSVEETNETIADVQIKKEAVVEGIQENVENQVAEVKEKTEESVEKTEATEVIEAVETNTEQEQENDYDEEIL